jgi:hypothetical protein
MPFCLRETLCALVVKRFTTKAQRISRRHEGIQFDVALAETGFAATRQTSTSQADVVIGELIS